MRLSKAKVTFYVAWCLAWGLADVLIGAWDITRKTTFTTIGAIFMFVLAAFMFWLSKYWIQLYKESQ